MKFLLHGITFAILVTGCSSQSAFGRFNMNKQQELSVSSSQTSKIQSQETTKGLFYATYLNDVDTDNFDDNEYFYIALYLKDTISMDEVSFDKMIETSLQLNTQSPIEIKRLPSHNQFSSLTHVKNEWNKYYLVTFKKENESVKKLYLVFKQDKLFSEVLIYQRKRK